MSDPLIKVSREGTQIGQYTRADAIAALKAGELRPDDTYWEEGMTIWKELRTLEPMSLKEGLIAAAVVLSIFGLIIWAIADANNLSLRDTRNLLEALRILSRL